MSNNNMSAADFIPVEQLKNYEAMKQFLTVRLVGQEDNKEMLATVPHKQLEDMAVIYYFDFGETPYGKAALKITNPMLDLYGISIDQLHKDAVEQAAINHPVKVQNLSNFMLDKTGVFIAQGPAQLYIATNDSAFHGAGVITYPDFMDNVAKEMGGSFFVLPSSLHEVLLIADRQDYLTPEELKNMVTTINAVEVDPKDRLTDNAYHYDADAKIFEQATNYEKRVAERSGEKSSVLADLGSKQRECSARPPKEKTVHHKADPSL